jgi:methyltransferase (TIGR00027 family)
MIPAEPSRTAWRVAVRRAAHQLLDNPRVLDDPLALRILGPDTAAALAADPGRFETGVLAPFLRGFFAVRSRFVEDRLAAARLAGIGQYVILGAGLDTFGYRVPALDTPLRVWEVDHPATQAWKREQLAEAEIAVPESLTFVPVDFERQALPDALATAGFDAKAGAVFSWLGVTPYLTRPAVFTTLKYLALATKTRGGVAFDYGLDPKLLTAGQRLVFESMAARVKAAGEPWVSFFDPVELVQKLLWLGFRVAEDVTPDALNARYLANRSDGLKVGGLAHIMWAGAA